MPAITSLFAIILALSLNACSTINPIELTAYSNLYSRVQDSGDLILDELNLVLPSDSSADNRHCDIDIKMGFRPCFYIALANGQAVNRDNDSADIKLRRQVLAIIATYNALLLDHLLEKPTGPINSKIDQLLNLSASVTNIFAASPLDVGSSLLSSLPITSIKALVTKLETAQAQQRSAKSLMAASGDIQNLISFIVEDTPALYQLYLAHYNKRLGSTKIALKRATLSNNPQQTTRLQRQLSALQSSNDQPHKVRSFELALISYIKILNKTSIALTKLSQHQGTNTADLVARISTIVAQSIEIQTLAKQLASDLNIEKKSPAP